VPAFEAVKDQVKKKAMGARQEEVLKKFLAGMRAELGYKTGPEAEKAGAEIKAKADAEVAAKAAEAADRKAKADAYAAAKAAYDKQGFFKKLFSSAPTAGETPKAAEAPKVEAPKPTEAPKTEAAK
jgi:hypothetical protein